MGLLGALSVTSRDDLYMHSLTPHVLERLSFKRNVDACTRPLPRFQAPNYLPFRQTDSITLPFINQIPSFVILTIDTVYHSGVFYRIYVSLHIRACIQSDNGMLVSGSGVIGFLS